MKKAVFLLFAMLLILGVFAGCAETEAEIPLTAENEIFTYDRVNPKKTQIVVARVGNLYLYDLCGKFEELNPDIQVIQLDITGGDSYYAPIIDWVSRGYSPDVMFSSSKFFDDSIISEYLVNLSADPVVENYEASALQRTSSNSNIYWLPGPSNINAIIYNKTLFENYGWEVPNTFDEFVALCLKITEDTGGEIEHWNPNAKYPKEVTIALEGFTYGEVFGGAANRGWYNDFISGSGSFAGHMEPYYNVVKTLAENGILKEEHFSYSATTRGSEFVEGKIAMINEVVYDVDNKNFDFSYMVFPSTDGELGYICDTYSCFVGIPQKEHSEAQQDAIDRFVAFFSSPEGQEIYIGDSLKVSNVKNVKIKSESDLSVFQPIVDAGHMFSLLDFHGELGTPGFGLYDDTLDIVSGVKTVEDCIAAVDASEYIPYGTSNTEPEIVASVPEDMTVLETSFYIADMYREKAGAEIALIANNAAYRGNLMRIFSGNFTSAMVKVLKPRSFENESTLLKLTMTGEQILAALNSPPNYYGLIADCVYAFSGLECEIAPWNPLGEKYLSVKLSGGAELEPEKLYTVAAWAGTISDEFITGEPEIIEGSWESLMTEKMKADGTVSAANDGRIKLIWN